MTYTLISNALLVSRTELRRHVGIPLVLWGPEHPFFPCTCSVSAFWAYARERPFVQAEKMAESSYAPVWNPMFLKFKYISIY